MSHKETALRIWFFLWLLATVPAAATDLKAEMQALEQARGTALAADSTILTAREIAGAVVVTGHLKLLAPDTKAVVSESFYLHVFRKDAESWRMVAGAATPVAAH